MMQNHFTKKKENSNRMHVIQMSAIYMEICTCTFYSVILKKLKGFQCVLEHSQDSVFKTGL